jgi:RNA polymerase sigma-70 factor, ECF subfamily
MGLGPAENDPGRHRDGGLVLRGPTEERVEQRMATGLPATGGSGDVSADSRADLLVDPLTDDLVDQAREGDLQAFEALYRRHAGRSYALALRMLGNEEEAEEATQDAWVRAWQRLDSFQGRSAFTTWLHRLTVNLLVDRLRRRRREEDRVEALDHPGVQHRTGRREAPGDRIDLERAIRQLPDGARIMFVLHQVEGLSCREVARETGTAVGTVKAQLHRARQLLKEYLR